MKSKKTPWRKIPEHIKDRVIAALKISTDELQQRNRERQPADTEQPEPVADCNTSKPVGS